MKSPTFSNLLLRLNKFRSWKLERISPTTYPRDITAKLKYITECEFKSIKRMMVEGSCYRCRISKGRFFFGASMSDAITAALESKGKGEGKNDP